MVGGVITNSLKRWQLWTLVFVTVWIPETEDQWLGPALNGCEIWSNMGWFKTFSEMLLSPQVTAKSQQPWLSSLDMPQTREAKSPSLATHTLDTSLPWLSGKMFFVRCPDKLLLVILALALGPWTPWITAIWQSLWPKEVPSGQSPLS